MRRQERPELGDAVTAVGDANSPLVQAGEGAFGQSVGFQPGDEPLQPRPQLGRCVRRRVVGHLLVDEVVRRGVT